MPNVNDIVNILTALNPTVEKIITTGIIAVILILVFGVVGMCLASKHRKKFALILRASGVIFITVVIVIILIYGVLLIIGLFTGLLAGS